MKSVTLHKKHNRWFYRGVALTMEQLLELSLMEAKGEVRIIRKD